MHPASSHSAPRPVVLPLVLLLAFLSFLSPSLAPAARAAGPVILRVKTTGATTGATCGTAWSEACDLQHALTTRADTSSGATYELWVAAGTYKPTSGTDNIISFVLKNGVALYGGFAGTETQRDQRNITANQTVLSGDLLGNDSGVVSADNTTRSDNSCHVLTAWSGTDNSAVLDGFIVRDGNAILSPGCTLPVGGGMYNEGGSPTVTNVTFTGNSAGQSGGGMSSTGGDPVLTNITFISNTAINGGGVYNDGGTPALANVSFKENSAFSGGGMANYNSSPVLTDVIFTSNSATVEGGGMATFNNSTPKLTRVAFATNESDGKGGGMLNLGSSPALTDVTFTGNTATGGDGGGMYNSGGTHPNLANVTFTSNEALTGGGMYNEGGKPALKDVTFSTNSADYGGGMINQNTSNPILTSVTFISNTVTQEGGGMYNGLGSSPTLTNTTFSGNRSNKWGGGIFNYSSSNPTLTSVTFSGNSATEAGGGMYNHTNSSPTIRGAIFWGNTPTPNTGPQIYNDGTSTVTIHCSVVEGGYTGGMNIFTDDPRLGALGDHGGATQTFPLLPGSSAINGAHVSPPADVCPESDQRGIARVDHDSHCDIGAYESRGFSLAETGGDPQSALLNTAFALPLQATFGETGGTGLPGVVVTYTAPSSGASAAWSGSRTTTQTSGANGIAAAPAPTANGTMGSYVVTASAPGVSGPVSFSLTNQASTTTALTASASTSRRGQAVTFTATVSVVAPGTGTPSGTVQFKDGAGNLGSAVAVSGGKASLSTAALSAGTHSLTAVYGGDANFAASASNALPHTVKPILFLPFLRR